MATFLLALDQATTTTGFAVFKDRELIAHGHKTFSGDNYIKRIEKLREWVESLITAVDSDIEVVIEDIQLQQFSNKAAMAEGAGIQTYKKLAHVQGALLTLFEEYGIDYYIALAAQWRKTCGIPEGRGRERSQLKAAAQAYVKEQFGINVTEDEADAICIGKHILISTDCYDWS